MINAGIFSENIVIVAVGGEPEYRHRIILTKNITRLTYFHMSIFLKAMSLPIKH
jgi:hypothetical protein